MERRRPTTPLPAEVKVGGQIILPPYETVGFTVGNTEYEVQVHPSRIDEFLDKVVNEYHATDIKLTEGE